MNLNHIIDGISAIASLGTLILIGIGLGIWKIQLKGENKFKLSLDALRELKLTLIAIDDYRNPLYLANEIHDAYSKRNNGKILDDRNDNERKLAQNYAENDRWNKIIEKYLIFEDIVLRFSILIDNYEVDLINGKRLKDYLIDIRNNRIKKEYADIEQKKLDNASTEDRIKYWEKHRDEISIIDAVLFRYDKDSDIFGKGLEQYLVEFNKRLRKYIK
ncbi:MAG: hypothetical protein FWC64_08290 [Treponema sp.]|nr:hypothetical protein [Treponema sp.]